MNSHNETHNCANCPSRQTTEWRDLSANELTFIDSAKRSRLMEPGEIIYHQGDQADGVYCIQSGLVGSRYINEDGNSAMLRLYEAGTTVGYGAFLSKQVHATSAEILSPGVVCFIAQNVVSKMLEINPKIGERFLQHSLADLAESENDYARLLTRTMKIRFLHLMMVFHERLVQLDENSFPFVELPISRTDIADLIGARPESISRLIRDVQDEGLLRIDGKHVVFSDIKRIQRELGLL